MDNKSKSEKNENIKKKSILKKVISIIEYIIIFIVILANAIMIFKSVRNPNKTPSLFGKKAFVIVSGSMIPEIHIGDIVITNDRNYANIGDIIAFRKDTTVIVHRIVKEMNIDSEIMYQTKGDNNNVEDLDLVRRDTIEGVCIGKIPYIGSLLMWLYNNLAIVIVALILIIIIKYFFSRD